MKTIQDRGYVLKEGRTLMPTATGMVVSGWLEEHFAEYVSDSFTAEMENELDEISRGERGYTATLTDFYTPFEKADAVQRISSKSYFVRSCAGRVSVSKMCSPNGIQTWSWRNLHELYSISRL